MTPLREGPWCVSRPVARYKPRVARHQPARPTRGTDDCADMQSKTDMESKTWRARLSRIGNLSVILDGLLET